MSSEDYPFNSGMITYPQANPNPMCSLAVSDIVKLANAGVKIDFKDVKDQVVPDGPTDPDSGQMNGYKAYQKQMVGPFLSRWNAHLNLTGTVIDPPGTHFSFYVAGAHFGDKMYLFVSTGNSEPVILEDDAALYPSDALIAKVHLLLKAEREHPT